MKQITILLFTALFSSTVFSQAVGVNTTNPHSSALLELNSTTNPSKGFLLPRLTSAQRTGIPSPAPGLMVYETTSNSIYIYTGSWVQLGSGGGGGEWLVNGTNIYNSNSGNVGVGLSTNINNKFTVRGDALFVNPAGTGIVLMNLMGGNTVTGGKINFTKADSSVVGTIFTNNLSNRLHLQQGSNTNQFVLDDDGFIGINTSLPSKQLDVAGSIRSRDTIVADDDLEAGDDIRAGNRIEAGGVIEGHGISSIGSLYVSGTSLLTGAVTSNSTANFTGNINSSASMSITDAAGILQFKSGSTTDKGFLQLSGDDLKIGTNSTNTNGRFIIRTGGDDQVYFNQSGYMGFDLADPLTRIHIPSGQDADLSSSTNGYIMTGVGTSGGTNLIFDNNEIMVRDGYTSPGTLYLQNDGGNLVSGAKLTINSNGEVLKLNGVNPNIGFYQSGVYRSFISQSGNELFVGVNGGKLHLDATQIAIGAALTTADAYKLAVTGKIICEELKVELSGTWPDYVFANDYKRPTLYDLESYIKQNKHLPNIPSAATIEKEGMEVGDMQKRMMEKIEELTLYIIELKKEIDELKPKK